MSGVIFWKNSLIGSATNEASTGEAGTALGNRAVGIVETQTGQAFTGTALDWARFGRGIGGDMTGVNPLVEGVYGYDISNQQQLNSWERAQRISSGVGQLSGTLASGLTAASRLSSMPQGPTVGGGATIEKLSSGQIRRIQNAANRSGQDIGVVGSRVNPNKILHSGSDWDYIINANSKIRRSLSKSLPGAKDIRKGLPSNQDIIKGTVDPNRPHIIFHPGR